ncbi:MAG TPA: SCO family protein [Candidatus Acidoferrum sp.]|nr:SCO family protein [Candidatus Acidoferrum sp.]
MSFGEGKNFVNFRWISIFLFILVALTGWAVAGCKKHSAQQAATPHRYYVTGKVVSVNKSRDSLVVDSQAIPGFMEAMTMPYSVQDPNNLKGVDPGDVIGADVVGDNGGGYLENIMVMAKSNAPPLSQFHAPQPGEEVPDFVLLNQQGRHIHLNSYRGHVLLVTFIYTRCPFANFCPLVSHNFAEIYAATKKDPKLSKDVRLLSITFDPEHDTSEVLRNYGESFHTITGGMPFDRWEFASASPKELPALAHFFGLTITKENGTIVHSLSTTVINADGKVYKWYDNNDWKPADLVADAAQTLAKVPSAMTASHAHASKPAGASGN